MRSRTRIKKRKIIHAKAAETGVNVMVLNCGSSSLKYKVIRMPQEDELVKGEAERVGIKTKEPSQITHYCLGRRRVIKAQMPDHSEALRMALDLVRQDYQEDGRVRFDVFAHRYVNPGNIFSKTAKIDKPALSKLKRTLELAAIHNPVSYKLIDFCSRNFKHIRQFAVFDTAFHKSIPEEFSTYALPMKLARKYSLRKAGFHGISHNYVLHEGCVFLRRPVSSQRVISCHLGTGGSSVCAINLGRSVNNSMGFTPLEGLLMNTRCGDLDLGAVLYIMSRENFSPDAAEDVLNKKSGILGIFNASSDLRDAIGMIKDPRAKMAFNMYVRRVKAYIGYYAIILKKTDVLIFTDSLGVGVPSVRSAVCRGLEFLGITIDERKNASYSQGICDISAPCSQTRVLVVPTDEEIMIAREAYKEILKEKIK